MDEFPRVATQEEILRRIRGEYLEMPGLRLKREQAQRLWGLDEATCVRLLEVLVEAGFLCRLAGGTYGRLTDGAAIGYPPLQVASAGLGQQPARTDKTSTAV